MLLCFSLCVCDQNQMFLLSLALELELLWCTATIPFFHLMSFVPLGLLVVVRFSDCLFTATTTTAIITGPIGHTQL